MIQPLDGRHVDADAAARREIPRTRPERVGGRRPAPATSGRLCLLLRRGCRRRLLRRFNGRGRERDDGNQTDSPEAYE